MRCLAHHKCQYFLFVFTLWFATATLILILVPEREKLWPTIDGVDCNDICGETTGNELCSGHHFDKNDQYSKCCPCEGLIKPTRLTIQYWMFLFYWWIVYSFQCKRSSHRKFERRFLPTGSDAHLSTASIQTIEESPVFDRVPVIAALPEEIDAGNPLQGEVVYSFLDELIVNYGELTQGRRHTTANEVLKSNLREQSLLSHEVYRRLKCVRFFQVFWILVFPPIYIFLWLTKADCEFDSNEEESLIPRVSVSMHERPHYAEELLTSPENIHDSIRSSVYGQPNRISVYTSNRSTARMNAAPAESEIIDSVAFVSMWMQENWLDNLYPLLFRYVTFDPCCDRKTNGLGPGFYMIMEDQIPSYFEKSTASQRMNVFEEGDIIEILIVDRAFDTTTGEDPLTSDRLIWGLSSNAEHGWVLLRRSSPRTKINELYVKKTCEWTFLIKLAVWLFHLLLWMFLIFLMIMQSQSGILFNNVVDDLSAMEFYGPTMAYLAIGGFFALHVLVNTQMVKPNSGDLDGHNLYFSTFDNSENEMHKVDLLTYTRFKESYFASIREKLLRWNCKMKTYCTSPIKFSFNASYFISFGWASIPCWFRIQFDGSLFGGGKNTKANRVYFIVLSCIFNGLLVFKLIDIMESILRQFIIHFKRVKLLGDILVIKKSKKYLDFRSHLNCTGWFRLRNYYITKGKWIAAKHEVSILFLFMVFFFSLMTTFYNYLLGRTLDKTKGSIYNPLLWASFLMLLISFYFLLKFLYLGKQFRRQEERQEKNISKQLFSPFMEIRRARAASLDQRPSIVNDRPSIVKEHYLNPNVQRASFARSVEEESSHLFENWKEALAELGLSQFEKKFEELGYIDTSLWPEIPDEEIKETGLHHGFFRSFRKRYPLLPNAEDQLPPMRPSFHESNSYVAKRETASKVDGIGLVQLVRSQNLIPRIFGFSLDNVWLIFLSILIATSPLALKYILSWQSDHCVV